ncbi:MAG: FecCD family ABC transporter permease [Pseudomonadota bacterium]
MRRPSTLAVLLAAAAMLLAAGGLAAGSDGWSLAALQGDAMQWALVRDIRAPRTLGAMLVGALLGVAGALAQGLFRNPLADPYLLGSAAGAGLGVVAVLAAGAASGHLVGWTAVQGLLRLGMVGAAFAGAQAGVLLTLLLARGAGRPLVLLLAGIVVGILLGAAAELLALASPEALRGRQVFLLGTTSFLGWPGVAVLCGAALLVLPLAWRLARVLDALVLGEAGAASLGLPLAPLRLLLVVLMALATGAAVAQAGLVAFVGLVAPHLVRRLVTVAHGALLLLSALAGAVLLGAADLAARTLLAPQELPVGLLTAVVGGVYLLALLRRRAVS